MENKEQPKKPNATVNRVLWIFFIALYIITGIVLYQTHWCLAKGVIGRIPREDLKQCASETFLWPLHYLGVNAGDVEGLKLLERRTF